MDPDTAGQTWIQFLAHNLVMTQCGFTGIWRGNHWMKAGFLFHKFWEEKKLTERVPFTDPDVENY